MILVDLLVESAFTRIQCASSYSKVLYLRRLSKRVHPQLILLFHIDFLIYVAVSSLIPKLLLSSNVALIVLVVGDVRVVLVKVDGVGVLSLNLSPAASRLI